MERRDADHNDSEDSTGLRLRLKGTFIDLDCDGEDGEAANSPRALSDPGSEVSSGYSSYFAKEQKYVAGLSQKVSKTWSSKRRHRLSHGSALSGHSADVSDSNHHEIPTQDESSENASMSRGNLIEDDDSSTTPMVAATMSGGATSTNFFFKKTARNGLRHGLPSSNSSDNSRDNMGIPDMKPIESTKQSERMDMNRCELRNLVHKKTAEIHEVLNYQRLSTALTSINEIPEQLEEVFQRGASNLLDEIQGDISVARDVVVNSDDSMFRLSNRADDEGSTADQAAQSIALIPDMVMASFENSFARAMTKVRVQVDDVIQGLESNQQEYPIAKQQMVKQMWAIPEEVRQITRQAVKEASQESRVKVAEQLDCVLQSFTDESKPEALQQAKTQIVNSVRKKKLPDTLRAATEAAESNVCQAIKFVEAKSDATGVVANRVVADTLLRAKVGPKLQDSRTFGDEKLDAGLETLRICNPGSVGHPQLCSRACLYFPLGKCENGMNCDFCHAPHSKRATHLDKRHREMLRTMDFYERFHYIYSILRLKLQALGVSPEIMQTFEALNLTSAAKFKTIVSQDAQVEVADGKKKNKEVRTLQVTLKFLSVRSLLTLLQHAPMAEGSTSPELAAVEELIRVVRPATGSGTSTRDPDEEQSQSHKSVGRSHSCISERTPSQRSNEDNEQ